MSEKQYISKIIKDGNNLYIKDTEAQQNISSHVGNTSNPHSVTKSQVGLGNVTNDAQVKRSEMGAASGVATLDTAGKVPTSQLPSYVDDVLEYDTKSAFPATGEAGKIYVDKSTNTAWRWSGSAYTQIKGDLVIGTTTRTAADGGVANTHYNNTSNPHSVTKAQVGLGSVVNTGDSATPVSGGTTKFTTGGAYTELNKKVDKVSGKGLSTNDYTTDEKDKLSGIASGAQVNVIETVKVNGTALTPSSKAVNVTVPTKTSELTNNSNFVSDASYVHTDNNYTATEKSKLSGIASGAEVNQNAFSNVVVGSTTISADGKTDSITLAAGSNITLTPDATNDKITIAATDTKYTAATAAPEKVKSSSAQGSSTNYARQDHTHGIDLATGDSNGQVKIAGTNVSVKGLGSAAYTNSTDYRKHVIAEFAGGGSSDGYCLVCTLTVKASYVNMPIEIVLDERGRSSVARLNILFNSMNNTDPTLASFRVCAAQNGYYIYKSATSTWKVYATKNEAWSGIKVVDYSIFDDRVNITWDMTNATLPSGATQATHFYSGSDTKVTQTVTTTSADYEVLFSATADNTTRTEAARKNNNLKFNPSTGNLQVTQLNGVTVGSSPKFTDTTYSSKAAASGGTDVSLVTTGEKYDWNSKTSNTGTVTSVAIKMNGTTKGTVTTSGTIDLGTVLTSHQDISGKQDKVAKLGSSTKPLYTSAAGTFTECSTYAGGTAVTLNGTSKAASTASLYAPTSAGTAGQILVSSAGAPDWKTGEILHYITSPSGTAGSTTSGARNRTQWTGTLDGVTTLYTGLTILYKVAVAGVSAGVTLNLSSLGEHPVVRNANTGVSTNYPVGAIIPLTYDADQKASVYVSETSTEYTGCWKVADYDANTTYSPLLLGFCYGTCSTAAGTAAKVVTMSSYALVAHGIVSIRFNNAITVASATLNINSKGAKAIYYKNAALAANVIQAGDIVTMQYNGSQYHIISIIRNSGLPKTDLSSEVQESLTKADETQLSTAYIGAGASTSAVAVAANLKSNLRRGAKTSVTASSNKLWVLTPSTYADPTVLMSGVEVPMTAQSNTTVSGVTYKVWSSNNTYTGTFNVVLL